MAALRYLCPQFLRENRLCWLYSPLFIVKNNGKEYYYYSDEEFNKSKIKGEVTRAKGLGALSPEQAHNSMFTEEFQRLETLEANDESLELLENLMGDEVNFRKEFIFENVDFSKVVE